MVKESKTKRFISSLPRLKPKEIIMIIAVILVAISILTK